MITFSIDPLRTKPPLDFWDSLSLQVLQSRIKGICVFQYSHFLLNLEKMAMQFALQESGLDLCDPFLEKLDYLRFKLRIMEF